MGSQRSGASITEKQRERARNAFRTSKPTGPPPGEPFPTPAPPVPAPPVPGPRLGQPPGPGPGPIGSPEVVSTPKMPAGSKTGAPETSYEYISGGAQSNLGHPVQYEFVWGDGSSTGWLPAGEAMAWHSWTVPGTWPVNVQARCMLDHGVVSVPSRPLLVTIGAARS